MGLLDMGIADRRQVIAETDSARFPTVEDHGKHGDMAVCIQPYCLLLVNCGIHSYQFANHICIDLSCVFGRLVAIPLPYFRQLPAWKSSVFIEDNDFVFSSEKPSKMK